ncbi:MAG: amidohydrolase [Deltaproteobacteria bacterium]|nr:amidohydrolase [Deltaproteobacteria bacterium]
MSALLAELLGCAASAAPAVDLAFVGGTIHTMDDDRRVVSVLAVDGGRVVYAGDDRGWVQRAVEVVDLQGGALFPGFVDAHVHLVEGGVETLGVQLAGAGTVEEMVARAEAWAGAHPAAEWIVGGGWDASTFNDLLRASQIDGIGRPVFLASADGHSAWVNHAALREAGIGRQAPDPDDGRFERDEHGAPNGTLRETAVDLVGEFLPEPTEAELDAGLAHALALARAHGITSAIDPNVDEATLATYARANLGPRVFTAVELVPGEHEAAVAQLESLRARFEGDRLAVDAAKLYVDGVVESQTAALVDPYDGGDTVHAAFTREEIVAAALAVDAAGFDLHAHAIGDAAVRLVLDAIEEVERAHGRRDRHPVIAHLELVHPGDLARFAVLDVLAAFQPYWAFPDPYITDWTIPVVGPDRAERLYPLGSVARAGGTLVGGSDWSVSTMNPWEAIEVAVTRRDPDLPGPPLAPGEAIDLDTALAMYTRDGARAIGREGELGTLEVGKVADLVWVDRDPYSVARVSGVRVVRTWIRGARIQGAGG